MSLIEKKKVLHIYISYFSCSDDGNYRPDPNRRNLLSMDAGLDDGYDRREGLLGRPRYAWVMVIYNFIIIEHANNIPMMPLWTVIPGNAHCFIDYLFLLYNFTWSEQDYGREPLLRQPLAREPLLARARHDEAYDDRPLPRRRYDDPYDQSVVHHHLYLEFQM